MSKVCLCQCKNNITSLQPYYLTLNNQAFSIRAEEPDTNFVGAPSGKVRYNWLGVSYWKGEGARRDMVKAKHYLKQAAMKGKSILEET